MKPNLLAPAEIGETGKVVNRPSVNRACASDHQKGRKAGIAVSLDRFFQRFEVDATKIVSWDQPQRIAAHATEIYRLLDTAMNCGRSVGGQPHPRCGDAAAARLKTQRHIASDDHGDQVSDITIAEGIPTDQFRGLMRTEVAYARDLFEQGLPLIRMVNRDLALDLDRRLIAASQIGIQSRGQHFRQHANRRTPAMHPAHKAGMNITCGEGQDIAHELFMNGGKIGRQPRNHAAKPRPRLVWHGLPHRAFANVLGVIEHIVQHVVGLRAEVFPVAWIKRFVLFRGDVGILRRAIDRLRHLPSRRDNWRYQFLGAIE